MGAVEQKYVYNNRIFSSEQEALEAKAADDRAAALAKMTDDQRKERVAAACKALDAVRQGQGSLLGKFCYKSSGDKEKDAESLMWMLYHSHTIRALGKCLQAMPDSYAPGWHICSYDFTGDYDDLFIYPMENYIQEAVNTVLEKMAWMNKYAAQEFKTKLATALAEAGHV